MDQIPASNILYPVEDWLQRDNALAKLSSCVQAYVADNVANDQTRAENTAKVYLAFCLGLQQVGILSIQHAPDLWIDIGETSYKICLQHGSIVTNTTVSEQSSTLSSGYVFVDATSGEDSVAGGGLSNLRITAKSPDVQTLCFLETVKKQICDKAVLAPEAEPMVQAIHITEPNSSTVEDVAHGLLRLDQVDMQCEKVGMGYNYAYHALGQAYGRAIGAQGNGPQGWKVARKSLAEMMQQLAAYRGLAYLNTAKGRLAWSKRLQRAHKFCLLVDIFGLTILDLSPSVSVSRLDKISLNSLEQVKRGHIGNELMIEIKLQLSILHS